MIFALAVLAPNLPAASVWTATAKTDWQGGLAVNATWYPETQLQLDWQGSATGASTPTAGIPWLAGWKYRRKITINNSLGYGLSDYQVWLPTGAFGANWTLIRSSAQTTMADFRFTPSTTATTIPYWIDSDTTTPNGFRVRISTLPSGNNTIYMYYGNPAAVVGSSATAVWGSGLIGYWAFGEGSGTIAKDASGSNNNGTLTNSPTWVDGKYGKCLNFVRTSSQYINIGSPVPAPLQVSSAFTLEAWINPASYGSVSDLSQIVGCQRDTGGPAGYTIFVDGRTTPAGKIHFQIGDGSAWHAIENPANGDLPPVSQWTHIVAIWSSGNQHRVYFNGVLDDAIYGNAWSGSVGYVAGQEFSIGRQNDAGRYFDGKIDEVRVYNRALSVDEIKSRYTPTEPTISQVAAEEGAFFSTATYRSNILDTGGKIVVSSVSWNPSSQPAGTAIAVGVRASSSAFSVNSATPAFITVSNGQPLNWHGRYIQYQSTFTTTNSTTTPRLEDIALTYTVKPWQEKSVTRTLPSAFGFGGGEFWEWQITTQSGAPLTITAYIRYNSEYGGSATKPKLTLTGRGISPTSISATGAAQDAWEQLTLNPGTPTQNATLTLRAEGFSTAPGAKFYIDDINITQ